MAPQTLVYNLDKKKEGALRILCLKLNIRVTSVPADRFGEPVGALAGVLPKTDETFSGEPFRDEMLVMIGFGEKMFNALLQNLRSMHIFIPLKAVLTPTNAQWNSVQLHDELVRERESMQNL